MRKLVVAVAAMILNITMFNFVAAAPFDAPSTPSPPVTATSATFSLPATSPIMSEVAAAPSAATGTLTVPSESVTDYTPVVTLLPSVEHKGWKITEHFEFSSFDGLLDSYNANEPVEFTVAGTSSSLAVEKPNGFNLVVTMFDPSRKVGRRAAVAYDSTKHAWLVRLSAPANNSTTYKLIFNLFCEKKESPCADTFGFGTQIDKSITLQVR